MKIRQIHSCAVPMVLSIALALVPMSAQAEPSASDRETARSLVISGRAKFDAGDYAGALQDFKAAHDIMGVPTTGLDLARAQAALGLLMEARSTALAVTRMPAEPSEPEAFTNARPAAQKLAEELAGRIPSLVITVKGVDAGVTLSTSVDGDLKKSSMLGLPLKVNPGAHKIEVSAPGYKAERRTVKINEGETIPVEVTLERLANQRALAGKAALSATSSPQNVPPGATPSGADGSVGPVSSVPTWVWVAGGAGLAALGAGVAFGIDYANANAKVTTDCPGNVCDPNKYTLASAQALAGRWNRDLGLFIGCGAVGVIGVSAAIVGIGLAPRRQEPPKSAVISPWLSPGLVGTAVQGKF